MDDRPRRQEQDRRLTLAEDLVEDLHPAPLDGLVKADALEDAGDDLGQDAGEDHPDDQDDDEEDQLRDEGGDGRPGIGQAALEVDGLAGVSHRDSLSGGDGTG